MTTQERMAKARAAIDPSAPRKPRKRKEVVAVEYTNRLQHIPDKLKPLFRRVWNGTRSRYTRIKAKCLDCCCYQRLEVKECTATLCPLWPIRPYQEKLLNEIQEE